MNLNVTQAKNIFDYLCRFLLFTLVLWSLLTSSFFNISNNIDKYFQDLFNTHLGSWVYPDSSQNSVAVLLLNDDVVDQSLNGQWPAPYNFHANVLGDLLEHQPAAVFIDFFWMNQDKPGAKDLVRTLKDYKNENIPVYMAAPSLEWFESFWPELAGLVHPVSAHVNLDPADFVSRSYPQAHQGLASAAFLMAENLSDTPLVESPRGDMDIFWGTAKNFKNLAWMDAQSKSEDSVLSSLKNGYSTVVTDIPYTTTVFVRDLINPSDSSDEAQEDLSNHLQDHVVIYGANISGVQDYIFLPTRNILPGAYYHAMAIDNLITWGDRYKSGIANIKSLSFTHLPLWLLQILFLLPLSFAFLWRGKQAVIDLSSLPALDNKFLNFLFDTFTKLMPSIKFWSFVIVYVLIICWYQYAVLDLAVANWIGFVQLLGLGVLIGKLDFVERVMTLVKKTFGSLLVLVRGKSQ